MALRAKTSALCAGAAEAVEDTGPFGRVGRGLDSDPIEGLGVETVERFVESGGVGLRVRGHFAADAQDNAFAFARGGIQIKRSRGAIVARMHAGRRVSAFGGGGRLGPRARLPPQICERD